MGWVNPLHPEALTRASLGNSPVGVLRSHLNRTFPPNPEPQGTSHAHMLRPQSTHYGTGLPCCSVYARIDNVSGCISKTAGFSDSHRTSSATSIGGKKLRLNKTTSQALQQAAEDMDILNGHSQLTGSGSASDTMTSTTSQNT